MMMSLSIACLATFCLVPSGVVSDESTGKDIEMNNNPVWESLLPDSGLEGWTESGDPWTPAEWTREGDTITGRIPTDQKARLVIGDSTWTDYEVSYKATLLVGSALQLHFRVSEGGGYYMIDMWPGYEAPPGEEPGHPATLISMRKAGAGGVDHLNKKPFPFKMNVEYDFRVVAIGSALSCYINGVMVNEVSHDMFRNGGIGLNMWHTTTAKYRDLKVRHIR